MNYNDISNRIKAQTEMSTKELLDILAAITKVYPMIILANLSKNHYTMLKDEGFLYESAKEIGDYDEMISNGVKNIHPSYQDLFLAAFERENLLRTFSRGTKEQTVKLYQKDQEGNYHWVSTQVIRIPDDSGDVVQICFNKVLEG